MHNSSVGSGAFHAPYRRLAARLALLAGTLAFCVLALEIALRVLGIGSPPMTERDAVVGQRFVRNFQGNVLDAESGRTVLLRFNHEGFRGPDRPCEKPPGIRRVALLGDSMIAALGVEEEETLAGRLERLLNQSPAGPARWEVLNFGIPGSSTGQELALTRSVVSRYQPDVVLVAFFVGNDLADNSRRLSNNPRIYFDLDSAGHLVQLPTSAAKTGLSAWLNRHSRLYVWQKEAIRRARYRLIQQAGLLEPGQWIYSTDESPDVAQAWKLTGALFAALAEEARTAGWRLGVIEIPAAQQIYTDSFEKMLEPVTDKGEKFDPDWPDRRLKELCQQAGVSLLSLTADFRHAAPAHSLARTEEWLFIGGEGHFNARGNRLAAEAVHRWLLSGNHSVARTVPLSSDRRVRD